MKIKAKTILLLILFLGFILRSASLDFPSIGYHNMKENEYLSMAEEMVRTGDFVSRRVYFYNAFKDDPMMELYPQLPLVSYQIIASWELLGANLWGPRLINIFFGLASILVIYAMARILFDKKRWALFCALLLSIMPLAVFFSRNLQPESP
ncbi:MAG: glycosyltransferase family 39 protein, partial [Candidatus Omnitrophica bacterium]|nr:glycosyltransferase family 39 protein [Candidatus Omnitrophota bacterium]